MTRRLIFSLPLLLALPFVLTTAAGAASAQGQPYDEQAEAESEAATRSTLIPGLDPLTVQPISLSESIALGLQNNLAVQIQRYAPAIAGLQSEQAWGAYDPTASADFGWLSASQPNTNSIVGVSRSTNTEGDGKVGVQGLVPYVGASLGVEVGGSRNRNNSSVQTLRPEYDSAVTVTTSIPLLRDLIWNQPWTTVKTSKVLYAGSKENFRKEVMDTVLRIEEAYWNLASTKEEFRVTRKSLVTAKALLQQTETQFEVGVVSRVAVVEAEAGVADRAFRVIVAENAYQRAQDVLVDATLGPEFRGSSNLVYETTDSPEDFVHHQDDINETLASAFVKRADLKAAEYEIERREFERKFAWNQRLPQLELRGSYTANGKEGHDVTNPAVGCRDIPPPAPGAPCVDPIGENAFLPVVEPGDETKNNLADSIDSINSSSGGDVYNVRAVLSIPLGNVTARKAFTQSEIELRRAKTAKRQIEQRIIVEVRDTSRTKESSYRGIEAAERRRLAAAEQLRAERIRLEHGESTPFDVLQRENDLVEAESQKIVALRAYRNSAAALARARGSILDDRNIVIDEVRALR